MIKPVHKLADIFVPRWLENLWHEKVSRCYTGPVTLHFRDGRVLKVEERKTREPQEFKD